MQTTGYFKVNNEKILVLAREGKYCRVFKIRQSGKDGVFFEDESLFLNDYPDKLKELKSGKVINL